MQLPPLQFLKESKGSRIMIELKTGDCYDGLLHSIDGFMNIKMKQVTITKRENFDFFTCDEIFIRGSSICNIKFRDDIFERIKELKEKEKEIIKNSKELKDNKKNNCYAKGGLYKEKESKERFFQRSEKRNDKFNHHQIQRNVKKYEKKNVNDNEKELRHEVNNTSNIYKGGRGRGRGRGN